MPRIPDRVRDLKAMIADSKIHVELEIPQRQTILATKRIDEVLLLTKLRSYVVRLGYKYYQSGYQAGVKATLARTAANGS